MSRLSELLEEKLSQKSQLPQQQGPSTLETLLNAKLREKYVTPTPTITKGETVYPGYSQKELDLARSAMQQPANSVIAEPFVEEAPPTKPVVQLTEDEQWLKNNFYPKEFLPLLKPLPEKERPTRGVSMIAEARPSRGGYRHLTKSEIFKENLRRLPEDDPLKVKAERITELRDKWIKEYDAKLIKEGKKPPPHQWTGLWDEIKWVGKEGLKSAISMSERVNASLAAKLAEMSEGAIWDQDALEAYAEEMYRRSQAQKLQPDEARGISKIGGFVATSIGQALPYMAGAVAGGLTAGIPGAFTVGFVVEGGEAKRRALELGASEEDAQMIELIVGTINGAIESLQVSNIIKFAEEGKGSIKAIKEAVRRKAWADIKAAGKDLTYKELELILREALEETLQETTTISSELAVEPTAVGPKEALTRIGKSALGGGVVGGVMGGGAIITAQEGAKTPTKPVEARTVQEGIDRTKEAEIAQPAAQTLAEMPEDELYEIFRNTKTTDPQWKPLYEEVIRRKELAEKPIQQPKGHREEAEAGGVLQGEGVEKPPAVPEAGVAEAKQPLSELVKEIKDAWNEFVETRPLISREDRQRRETAEKRIKEARAKFATELPPKGTEPWQMTRRQFEAQTISDRSVLANIEAMRGVLAEDIGIEHEPYISEAEATTHRREVEKAIKEGKPVPRHVLEEYKDESWAKEALGEPAVKSNWESGQERPFAFDENSTQNEGRFRLYPTEKIQPKTYRSQTSIESRGIEETPGVRFLLAKTKEGETVIQTIRFDKSKFTEEQAAQWWQANKDKLEFYEQPAELKAEQDVDAEQEKENSFNNWLEQQPTRNKAAIREYIRSSDMSKAITAYKQAAEGLYGGDKRSAETTRTVIETTMQRPDWPGKVAEQKKPVKRIISKETYEAARKRLLDRSKLSVGIDPQGLVDMITVGAYHFESGVRKFTDWSKKMVEDMGDWVKPHLKEAWSKVQEKYGQADIGRANTANEVNEAAKELLEMTSARQADIEQDRDALGLEAMPSKERKAWQTSLQNAKDKKISDRALRLAGEIAENPRALNDEETAGLVIRATELKSEHRQALKEINETKDPAQVKMLSAEIARIESEFEAITRALYLSGTEKGRALVAQKLTIDRDFDLISVKSRAKAAKGRELTGKETSRFAELTQQLEETTDRMEQMQRRIDSLTAERAIKRGGLRKYGRMTEQQRNSEYDRLRDRILTLLKEGCYS